MYKVHFKDQVYVVRGVDGKLDIGKRSEVSCRVFDQVPVVKGTWSVIIGQRYMFRYIVVSSVVCVSIVSDQQWSRISSRWLLVNDQGKWYVVICQWLVMYIYRVSGRLRYSDHMSRVYGQVKGIASVVSGLREMVSGQHPGLRWTWFICQWHRSILIYYYRIRLVIRPFDQNGMDITVTIY